LALREPGDRTASVQEAPSGSADAASFPTFPSRLERFEIVGSTNDVVARWLDEGTPEVCIAVADAQTSGRGRHGRAWVAPPGAALLASVGFRPSWLAPDRLWRLAAVVALAMADAAEDVAGLADGTIRLKWPNDLVVAFSATGRPLGSAAVLPPDRPLDVRKLAGLLGETDGLGTDDVQAVVGIGLNADWPREAFPPDLAPGMTSLREASGGRPIDRVALLEGFLARLETRVEALRGGYFDVAGWTARQLTAGRAVRLERPDGSVETVRALGVDATSGALVVAEGRPGDGERQVLVGEIRHLRLGTEV
jgi:BirA family biotin operon repressor/biotin-[acetyl-CoA-carboxylase] ligase